MNFTHHKQAGYSIVEVLVAITVLLIAIVGPMTIASKGLQSAQLSQQQNTASFLAQEGVELILNLRNERALEYFNNPTPATEAGLWSWTTAVDCDPDTNVDGCALSIDSSGSSVINECANKEACRLYLGTSGRLRYTTDTSDDRTAFVRQVFIDPIVGVDQVNVRSIVSWDSNTSDSEKTVELFTVVANIYKPNP